MNPIKRLEGKVKLIVRAGAKKSRIISYEKGLLRLSIKTPPEKGKANVEIVKFLRKKLKKEVRIISGFKSREKIVELY